ncbi:hypothetical protein JKY72_06030 [Candidatus Gracilibacteria bacterium]|nr:hypothetical protein [Candidatus Gracilibacteria bacterium]
MSIFFAFGAASLIYFLMGGVVRLRQDMIGTAKRIPIAKLRFSFGIPVLLCVVFFFGAYKGLLRYDSHYDVIILLSLSVLAFSKWIWDKIQQSDRFALYEGLVYLSLAAIILYGLTLGVK